MKSFCTNSFWEILHALPNDVQELAAKSYRLWLTDPDHPSVQFKKLKDQKKPVWEARIGSGHRAFCVKDDQDFIWYWIGTKAEAKKLY